MAKTILEEALEDANTLKKTAIENAKNVLVEAISPKIKEFVESQLGECMPAPNMEGPADDKTVTIKVVPVSSSGMEGEAAMPPQMMQEPHDDEAEDMDLLSKLGLLGGDEDQESGNEEGEESSEEDDDEGNNDMDEQFVAEETQVEAKEEDKDEKKEKMDETVEITNEDLKVALAEVLGSIRMTEATVTKGFGDVEDATLPASGGKGQKGIADEKAGEHQWKDVTPPAAKDLTVKEAKVVIAKLQKEYAAVKAEGAEYKKAYEVLKNKLQEVNLFNSKLLHTQKLLNSTKLNNEQRLGIIETFDKAQTMREVELVYRSLSESFKIAGGLSESKQVQASKAKASKLSTPSSTVLKEAMANEDKKVLEESRDVFASRMQELAGIID